MSITNLGAALKALPLSFEVEDDLANVLMGS